MTARCNTAALFERLDAQRDAGGMSWRDVADATGQSASFFTRIGQGHAPSAHGLAACLTWLGVDAFWITKEPTNAG